MNFDVLNLENAPAGSIELPDEIFGLEPRKDILHRMVTYQLAKRQQGTHKTKERGEVAGTTKKYGRQKGGGGARHGNKKANIFRGGGVSHGPRPRSHATELPKKLRALALRHALSAKRAADELIVIDEARLDDVKTKALIAAFDKLGCKDALIVDSTVDEKFGLASRNIPDVDVLPVMGANVYDILRRRKLVLTKAAVEGLEARLNGAGRGAVRKGGSAKADAASSPENDADGFSEAVDLIVLIDGIGEKTAEALKGEGVEKLTQLVALSDEDRAALFEKLDVADQAEKEDWLVQAREMIAGGAPRAKVDQTLAAKLKREAKEG